MIMDVAEAPALGRVAVGGKAAVLAELSANGSSPITIAAEAALLRWRS
jgi:hypothetical protein